MTETQPKADGNTDGQTSENDMETVVTTRSDDGSLEYHPAPKFDVEVGATADIGEYFTLSIDGEMRDVFVSEMVIQNRSREFIADEREWYIEYDVQILDRTGRQLKIERLSESDVIVDF